MSYARLKYSIGLLLLSIVSVFLCLASANAATVSGTIWIDQNNDGIYAKGEDSLKNVPVWLEQVSSSGDAVSMADTQTEKDGSFSFSSVKDGTYRLRVKLPNDYRFALPGYDSAALPASGSESFTIPFQVTDQNVSLLIGATRSSSSITFVAFEDRNANGGRMNSEPLIRDVSIELFYSVDGTMYPIASVMTNRNGEAKIGTLSPAHYLISVTLPDGYTFGPMGQKINQWYNCMPLSDGIFGLSDPVEVPAKTNMGFGIGMVKTGSISGSVWFDQNATGRYTGTMLSGFSIDLTNTDNGFSRTVQTDAEGKYAFLNLPAGHYSLDVTLPEEYMFARGDSLFSDPLQRTGSLPNMILETGENIQIDPIGVMRDTSVAVQVYVDMNCNAMFDTGEPCLEEARLSLTTSNGTVEANTNTDGYAAFHGLTDNSAMLRCVLPDGFIFTKDGGDSLLTYSSGRSNAESRVAISLGSENSVLIGATYPSSIAGSLYEDTQLTGSFRPESVLLSGFQVELIGENGVRIASTETNESGTYLFDSLPGGLYKVRFHYQDPYIASTAEPAEGADRPNRIVEQNMSFGDSDPFMLLPGEEKTVDGALFQAGSIDGYVLLNSAYDQLQTNEGGHKGVKVTLLTENGTLFAEHLVDETDEDGHYYIKGIPNGTYLVCLNAPDLSVFVYPVMGSRQWTSDPVTVVSGKNVTLDPVGTVKTTLFSGSVIVDPRSAVQNSIQAAIELRSRTFGTLLTRQTDENGNFEFRGLLPDTYDASVTVTEGYLFTGSTDDFVPMSPNNKTACELNIAMGSDWQNKTVTVSLPSSLSVHFYYDENNSGTFDAGDVGIDGFPFEITGPGGTTETAADGSGSFDAENLYPGEYTLLFDLDSDTVLPDGKEIRQNAWSMTLNLQDGEKLEKEIPVLVLGSISGNVWNLDGESGGIGGRAIRLMKDSAILDQTESDASGAFHFDRLYPGTYTLDMSLPEDYVFARKQDTVSRASYILNTGVTYITLKMGENAENCDIGIGAIGAIGDLVWLDSNGNGLQDIGEPGIPDIRIVLSQYGEKVAEAVTDPYGLYEIEGLYPGVYTVRVFLPDEVKTTRNRTDFPLVASVIPQDLDGEAEFEITVPSGEKNLNMDIGLVLKTNGVYPANMNKIPTRNWTPYSERR